MSYLILFRLVDLTFVWLRRIALTLIGTAFVITLLMLLTGQHFGFFGIV